MRCIGIIWNRAIKYEEEITSLILPLGTILYEQNINLGSKFDDFILGIYFDANPIHIQAKIQALKCCSSRIVKLIVFDIKTNYKYFSVDKGMIVYKNIEVLKEKIRHEISLKIPNYYFDVIFHLTDSEFEYMRTLHFLQDFLGKNKL